MPRGGPRPGAGRPPEGVESRTLRITLPPEAWGQVDHLLATLSPEASRARTLGQLLLLGVEAYHQLQLPWWRRLWWAWRRGGL